ncbi:MULTISPECIES: DUF4194 domain-containing protein [unclassified Spirosoma]|uniref:DUF4194 domain-containing protein n=1 Tax=unclassified Spirosoma TaxID=2621999 RepID=UPI00095D0895|nr:MULTISPECIES: DUF4194 domain-containing protein [unclassified Spirosoma]MBN8823357.1 DUF4194 domain-containing protein [Spirosoma sp.]OJW72506.1 MAG: hypothetical protein BGO59_15380 [Spirosoma sp. 48-14]
MSKPYASAIVKLLQSHAIYDDDRTYWQLLDQYETPIRDYFQVIGVTLDLNRREGYARLVQKEIADDESNAPIKLIRRVALSYEQSLLAILLREWLEEHELAAFAVSSHLSSNRLFVTREQVRDRIELFFKNQPNRKALVGKLDSLIEKLADIGLLKQTRKDEVNPDNTQYEVKPLLKAKLPNEKLEEFRNKLQVYVESI